MFDILNFIFDYPFECLTMAVAIAALVFARRALDQAKALRARLDLFEAVATARVSPPPIPIPRIAEPPVVVPAAKSAEAEVTEPSLPPLQPPPAPPPVPQIASVASAPAGPGFEERLGTRWVVWVGGLTLALGGFFMVRYSIEQGLLGPGVRTLLGGLFALVLLAAGEWTRRQESISAIATLPIANIPAMLTAAGTAAAFATVYAAYALYDFLVPATAFVLLGLVALGTLAAALLHGPALAGLGIAAAFLTPVLVSSGEPDYWALYLYLAIVTAAAYGLARIRLWRWLAVTTVVLATLWIFPGLQTGPAMVAPHTFHAMAGFVLAALLVVCGFMFGPDAEPGRIEPVSSASLAAMLFAAMLIVLNSGHADLALIVFGLLVAGAIYVAWRAEAATAVIAAAAGFVAVVFLEWAVRGNPDMLVVPGGPLPGIGPRVTDGSVSLHLIAAAALALTFGAAGFLAQGRSATAFPVRMGSLGDPIRTGNAVDSTIDARPYRRTGFHFAGTRFSAIVPVVWSAAAVFTPLALLVALYARIAHVDRSIPFAILAVLLAAAFGAATEQLNRRDGRPGQAIAVALFATGTLAALALALTFALEKGWLTIALALMALGTAWISTQRPIPFLRWLAAILAGIVVARIGYEPRIVGDAVGTTPIFNWLLWGYGIPALSFWTASVLLRRGADDPPLRVVESAAILFTVLLAFMEIRHAVNGGEVYRDSAGLTEVALQVCVALAMAIGLERLRIRTGSIVHNVGAVLLTGFAGLASVFGLLFFENPMVWAVSIDGVFINQILLGYAMPAILALLLSYAVAGRRPVAYANTIAGSALVLALIYVTLEIRRLYHGPALTSGATGDAEQYTYSVAWLVFGVVLLGAGVVLNSQRARLASAVVIALTVAKAFLIDMSTLTGVYRALSFMCLGLVLVAIGWLYQRILFSRRAGPPVPSSAAAVQPEA